MLDGGRPSDWTVPDADLLGPVPCFSTGDCGTWPNHYCKASTGCLDSQTVGRCEVKPTQCPMMYGPQCGCDGKTYDNPCLAASAGVNIRHAGACLGQKAVCDAIKAQYASLLEKAKYCMVAADCVYQVDLDLIDPCRTYVASSPLPLAALEQDWNAQECYQIDPPTKPSCPVLPYASCDNNRYEP